MEDRQPVDEWLLQLTREISVLEKQDLRKQLIDYINLLLLQDFNKLLHILYKVDVDEEKLKILLKEQSQIDAAVLIADLLIQRQEEKKQTRLQTGSEDEIPGADRW